MTTASTPTSTATTSERIEGVATLLSSLSHGGEHAGTIGFLRREKIVGPHGNVVEIPVVSGNALRGLLRRHAADAFWDALGRPALPVQVFHLLRSGGALAKAGSSHVLGARQLQQVRAMVPVVSLFGGSGAGKIIEGKLSVGKLTPICAETVHLLPSSLGEVSTSIWQLLQIEEFTRTDDSKKDQLHELIAGAVPAAIEAAPDRLLDVARHEPALESSLDDGPAQQMRYGVETIAAGTRLHWWMQLRHVTDVERALMAEAVQRWVASGAHIGGRSATGHGRLRLDVHQWTHDTPTVTVGQALAAPTNALEDHVAAYRPAIDEALSWFA